MKENKTIHVLTSEEQRNLIRGSYCHQYGILFRLAMFTGLKTNELLGLQWADVDFYGRRLCVRHVLAVGSDGLGIRFSRFPRYIPLTLHMCRELSQWREELAVPAKSIISNHNQCNSVASTITGYQIDPSMLDYYFQQIAQFCGIHNLTYSDLRNMFAVKFLEQGGALETLGELLGEPSTVNVYATFALNADSSEPKTPGQCSDHLEVTYPVVARKLPNGFTQLYVPNFPEETIAGPILSDGLIILREKLEDRLQGCDHPPAPVPVSDISCEPGASILQITLKL